MINFYKNLFGKSNKNKHHFLITSHGQTASMWLAAVLNSIPEIFCSHGYTYPPIGADLKELTGDDYNLRQASANRFESLSLKNYFAELDNATSKPIVGNVLAFYLSRLFSRIGSKIKKQQFTVVNMVRHPVTRLTSTLKTWSFDGVEIIPPFVLRDFANRCDHLRNFIQKSHTVDFDNNKNKVFVVALLAMEDIAKDVKLAKLNRINNIKYEEITTNKDYFKNFVQNISANKVNLSNELLESIFCSKKINIHNRTGINEAHLQYKSWETWKQDVFRFTMQKNNMFKIYEEFNYDFSFF